MPNLIGQSFRAAEITLQQQKLKLEDTLYRPDITRSVLEQHYKGQPIKPGTKIPMGSGIVLVIGIGTGSEELDVPDLFGVTLGEARSILESSGLNIGTILPAGADPNQYVYRQAPDYLTTTGSVRRIRQGQLVDLWVQAEKPVRQQKADSTGAQP
jgi:beta-lactam-binding protein with PASTA domain